jgi:Xaa-Pro dipeptidase
MPACARACHALTRPLLTAPALRCSTFPVDGRFTPLQAGVYGAVLSAQRAVLAAAAPGVAWPEMHVLAERHILAGLREAGLLRGDVEAMLAAGLGGTFMPHGVGHLLGLDTHDVGGYPAGAPPRPEGPGRSRLRTARLLEPRMVLTVEPGCYFNDYLLDKAEADASLSPFLVPSALAACRGMGGVRLEDNVVVTDTGVESLTRVPRDIADVERVMAGAAWP